MILRNEPGIVSLTSVVTVRGVVSVIRGVDPVVNYFKISIFWIMSYVNVMRII